jgi:hypothetical protein
MNDFSQTPDTFERLVSQIPAVNLPMKLACSDPLPPQYWRIKQMTDKNVGIVYFGQSPLIMPGQLACGGQDAAINQRLNPLCSGHAADFGDGAVKVFLGDPMKGAVGGNDQARSYCSFYGSHLSGRDAGMGYEAPGNGIPLRGTVSGSGFFVTPQGLRLLVGFTGSTLGHGGGVCFAHTVSMDGNAAGVKAGRVKEPDNGSWVPDSYLDMRFVVNVARGIKWVAFDKNATHGLELGGSLLFDLKNGPVQESTIESVKDRVIPWQVVAGIFDGLLKIRPKRFQIPGELHVQKVEAISQLNQGTDHGGLGNRRFGARGHELGPLHGPGWAVFPKIYAFSQPVVVVIAFPERHSPEHRISYFLIAAMETNNEALVVLEGHACGKNRTPSLSSAWPCYNPN